MRAKPRHPGDHGGTKLPNSSVRADETHRLPVATASVQRAAIRFRSAAPVLFYESFIDAPCCGQETCLANEPRGLGLRPTEIVQWTLVWDSRLGLSLRTLT